MLKILKKFMKEHFELKDNVIDKNLTSFIKSKEFCKRKNLHFAIDDMFTFFAIHFTAGNKDKSKKLLEAHGSEIRQKDAVLISFFAGASTVMIMFGTFLLGSKSSDGDYDYNIITSSLSIIRLTFVMIYVLFACGFCVQVFKAYGVNYLYIFEFDPHAKIMED
jgi:hypothetical protein